MAVMPWECECNEIFSPECNAETDSDVAGFARIQAFHVPDLELGPPSEVWRHQLRLSPPLFLIQTV